MTFDAIVIGAGHNGLIAACYLAEAGFSTLVIERRQVVGGSAVTEEIFPDFLISVASYSLSLLRPDISAHLDLARHGLRFYPKDPQLFVPLPDGRHFFVWRDLERTAHELNEFHHGEGDAYRRWSTFFDAATTELRPLIEDPDPPHPAEIESDFGRRGLEEVWRLGVAGSIADCVSHFFTSDEVRGAFASQGLIGTAAGPFDEGTAWVGTYHGLGGELNGMDGTWAFVEGGMGSVTAALASAAAERGVQILTDQLVEEVLVDDGAARGVRTVDGVTHFARVVLSNTDPKRMLALLPDGSAPAAFAQKVASWITDGCVVKVNFALDGLPHFNSVSTARGTIGPEHRGTTAISPALAYLQQAYEDSLHGAFSAQPFMEFFIASSVDPTLAPKGKHVASAFSQWAPARVSEEDWDSMRDRAGDVVIETIAERAPDFRELIIDRQILGPPDLQRVFGLSGGDIFHGSILPNQSFGNRFDYRTGLPGLYLCGSGARPGGAVMGAAGRNCARAVLQDLTSRRRDSQHLPLS